MMVDNAGLCWVSMMMVGNDSHLTMVGRYETVDGDLITQLRLPVLRQGI